jgi:hypothetical protein
MSQAADILAPLGEWVGRFLVPRSYLALKSRLFTVLCLSIALQLGFQAELIPNSATPGWPSFKVETSEENVGTVLVCALAMCFLLSTDLVLAWQRKRMALALMNMLKDPGLSDDQKRRLMDEIIRLNQTLF